MNAYKKIEKLADKDFKLITGVTREVFFEMLEVLKQRYAKDHTQGGQSGLLVEIRLTLALEYWREHISICQTTIKLQKHNQQGRNMGRGCVKRIS